MKTLPEAATAEVLELARIVLARQGFSIEGPLTSESGRRFFVAEDPFFIVAVTAALTVADAHVADSEIGSLLAERVRASDPGGKGWDAYLVLLIVERLSGTSALFDLNYDTRYLRRIARADVEPLLDHVEAVLRPFAPLPDRAEPQVVEDALAQLQRELEANEVSSEDAQRAIAAFRTTGSLASV